MAIALTPDAFLLSLATPWDTGVYFSWCGWRRLDVDRGEFTGLCYLGGNTYGSGGFQIAVDPDRQLMVFDAGTFDELLGGTGPTFDLGDWWFLGITTIAADVPDNVEIYYAQAGDLALNQVTASYAGAYDYQRHYIAAKPGADGSDDVFRLHGGAAHDRTWQDTTLTPTEMLDEFESPTVVKSGAWSVWPMEDAATATADASGNGRTLTATPGTGTITDTDGPFDSSGQAITPSVTTIDAAPGTLALSVDIGPAAVTIDATPGSVALALIADLDAPTIDIAAGSLAVAPGAAAVLPDSITAEASPGAMTATPGPAEVTPAATTIEAAAGELTVSNGGPVLTGPTVDVAPGGLAVAAGTVDVAPAPAAIAVAPGAVGLTLDVPLTAPVVVAEPGSPALGPGAGSITPAAVTIEALAGAIVIDLAVTVEPPAIDAAPGVIDLGLAVQAIGPVIEIAAGTPTITTGAAAISVDTVLIDATPGDLEVAFPLAGQFVSSTPGPWPDGSITPGGIGAGQASSHTAESHATGVVDDSPTPAAGQLITR